MIRKITTVFVVLFVAIQVNSEQIDKVGPALNYWYNFYFDPDWIRHVEDSINNMRSAQIADSVDLLPPPKLEPGKPWVSLDQAPIEFVDGVPYVDALIRYTGNGSDLHSLGVLFRYVQGAKTAMVNFPLRQLPYVLALPSIESIPDRTSVNLHNQENVRNTAFSTSTKVGAIILDISSHTAPIVGRLSLFNRSCTYSNTLMINRQRLIDEGSPYVILNKLRSDTYHLCFLPTDTFCSGFAISDISVYPDSCTSVEFPEQLTTSKGRRQIEFTNWQRTPLNVFPYSDKYRNER